MTKEKFRGYNTKIVWKEVKRVRKGEQERDDMVKDVNGHNNILVSII